jgi:hypothetical protein
MNRGQIGGSFAPPLPPERLEEYKALAESADPQTADGMRGLVKMLETFSETPRSAREGQAHPVGRGVIVPLEEAEVKRIWDVAPWREELDMLAGVFDRLDPVAQKALRDAAFHLLWFGYELTMDREPLTADLL